jgi:hypothetical protein
MIVKGRLSEGNEDCGFCSVFISTKNGDPIDGNAGGGTTTDENGNFSITLTDNEMDQYVTFQGVTGKKTLDYSYLNCGSDICEHNIDLSANFLPEISVVAVKSFWEKYKYYIIGGLTLIIVIFAIYKLRK